MLDDVGLDGQPDWLHAASIGTAPASTRVLMDLISAVRDLTQRGDDVALDSAIAHARPSEMPVEAMVALLRYSAPIRSRLPGWEGLLASVRAELGTRNLDTAKLLRGFGAVRIGAPGVR